MLKKAVAVTSLPVVDLKRAVDFYEKTLGLKRVEMDADDPSFPSATFEAGKGTQIYLYQRGPTKADHTVLSFVVDDLDKEMTDLRSRGVVFEEYDMPGLKTVNGVASVNSWRSAWFKDTEGNIIAIGEEA